MLIRNINLVWGFLLILFLTLSSCRPDDKFADEPFLEWLGYEVEETDPGSNRRTITIQTYFTDGDGDIGLQDTVGFDGCNPANYNLLIRYFEQRNGVYHEIPPTDSCLLFHVLILDITPEGQNKTLEGDIFAGFDYSGFPRNANVDSIRFELQLRDRAGHLSNIAASPSLVTPQ